MPKITPTSTEEHRSQLSLLQTSMKVTYDSIRPVICPVLQRELDTKDKIHFNARGWYHLQHDIHGKPRSVRAKIHKLLLVPLIASVLRNATTIDEHRELKVRLKRKKGAPKTLVDYWAFIVYVGKKRNIKTKVIVIKPKNAEKIIF